MTTRLQVAQIAESLVGTVHVSGYDQPNPFSRDLGRPVEAWCGDFVTDVYKRAGIPLPSMQGGCRTGFAYCPSAVNWARVHNAVVASWQAKPGDLVLFDWNANGEADHVEMAQGHSGDQLVTVGGNSGPNGGVNRHTWTAPAGRGNRLILAVLDASHAVHFGADPVHHAAAPAHDWPGHRLLMLKSPRMHGADVEAMQRALIAHHVRVAGGPDGFFGPHTWDALVAFQRAHRLQPDGIRGPLTFAALGA